MATCVAAALAAVRQAQHLQRQDRQHAGHQVQHQPAKQRQYQHAQQALVGMRRRRALRIAGRGIGDRTGSAGGRRGLDRCLTGSQRRNHQRRSLGLVLRRHDSGRHIEGDAAGHRRIADTVGLAALEGGHQGHVGRIRVVAQQRQGHFGLVEIHHHIAEVLVAVGLALRPARQPGAHAAGAFQCQRGAVAVDVVARRRGEAQQQAVAVADDGFEVERLLGRQRQRVHAGGLAGGAEQARAGGAAWHQRAQIFAWRSSGLCPGGIGRGQVDADFAPLRRIAHAGIGAALVLHLQDGGLHRRVGLAGQGGLQLLAVGLHLAEELVVFALALRQRQFARGKPLSGLDADAVAIQVVARCDLPVQRDAVAAVGGGAQREGLVHWQQILFADRQGGESGQGQQAQGGDTVQHGHRLTVPHGFRRTPTAGRQASRRRPRARSVRGGRRGAARTAAVATRGCDRRRS